MEGETGEGGQYGEHETGTEVKEVHLTTGLREYGLRSGWAVSKGRADLSDDGEGSRDERLGGHDGRQRGDDQHGPAWGWGIAIPHA